MPRRLALALCCLGAALALAGAAAGALPGLQTGPPPWPVEWDHLAQRLDALNLPALREEGQVLHIHQHLDVVVAGRRVQVPLGIGIDYDGAFISPIHTHDTTGVIHIESPTVRTFTLGQLFGVWGVRLTPRCVGGLCAKGARQLRVFVGGKPLKGDPTKLALREHREIVVTFGTSAQLPRPLPRSYRWPAGL